MEDNKYFIEHAILVSTKGKCLTRKVGCIIVKEGRIISMGYNGTPKGYTNCIDGGCPRCKNSKKSGSKLYECLCVHAEINAIVFAARNGVNISGCDIYTTSSPCLECAKAIINGNIKRVIYQEVYSKDALNLLKKCNIKLIMIK